MTQRGESFGTRWKVPASVPLLLDFEFRRVVVFVGLILNSAAFFFLSSAYCTACAEVTVAYAPIAFILSILSSIAVIHCVGERVLAPALLVVSVAAVLGLRCFAQYGGRLISLTGLTSAFLSMGLYQGFGIAFLLKSAVSARHAATAALMALQWSSGKLLSHCLCLLSSKVGVLNVLTLLVCARAAHVLGMLLETRWLHAKCLPLAKQPLSVA